MKNLPRYERFLLDTLCNLFEEKGEESMLDISEILKSMKESVNKNGLFKQENIEMNQVMNSLNNL